MIAHDRDTQAGRAIRPPRHSTTVQVVNRIGFEQTIAYDDSTLFVGLGR
jgi:hypothetical protein